MVSNKLLWVVLFLSFARLQAQTENSGEEGKTPAPEEDEEDLTSIVKRLKANKERELRIEEKDSDELQLPPDYNKEQIPPSHNSQKPLKVAVFINIRGVNSVDMRTEKITLDLDFYAFWADKRFHANNTHNLTTLKSDEPFHVQIQRFRPEFSEKLWVPDIFFENTVLVPHNDFTSHPLLSFNSETGFVKYTRLEITSPCPMSYFYYPLDIQYCDISLRSYRYLSDQIDFSWVHSGVILALTKNDNYDIRVDSATKEQRPVKNLNFPNLLEKVHLGRIVWNEKTVDVLKFTLLFRRNASYHLAQTYLPSSFFILITWLCFLLPPSMAATRVGITMTTLLTINTMFNSVREHSPKVSYAKAIDFWMIACTFFVFLALFEFCFISWLEAVKEREEKRKKEHDEEEKKAAAENSGHKECPADIKLNEKNYEERSAMIFVDPSVVKFPHIKMMDPITLKRWLKIRKILQNYGLVLLASAFCIFNLLYWAWICAASDYFNWNVDAKYNVS